MDYRRLGQRIRAARLRLGLTQERLAEAAGISVPHLSNIENGKKRLGLETLLRIALALGVTPDRLLGGGCTQECGEDE